MAFDLTKPVQTRDGRKARIICTDRKGDNYSIIALVTSVYDGEEDEDTNMYTTEGLYWCDGQITDLDLINIPERHEHADLIIAWANGAKIQFFSNLTDIWSDTKLPTWDIHTLYRIKPE
jgi:hypothetical protein